MARRRDIDKNYRINRSFMIPNCRIGKRDFVIPI